MPRPANAQRQEALRTGAQTYLGTECTNGHTERHVRSGNCVTCQRDALRKRRADRRNEI